MVFFLSFFIALVVVVFRRDERYTVNNAGAGEPAGARGTEVVRAKVKLKPSTYQDAL